VRRGHINHDLPLGPFFNCDLSSFDLPRLAQRRDLTLRVFPQGLQVDSLLGRLHENLPLPLLLLVLRSHKLLTVETLVHGDGNIIPALLLPSICRLVLLPVDIRQSLNCRLVKANLGLVDGFAASQDGLPG
jgi:hypothetical protein